MLLFEPHFSEASYGFRSGRSAQQAVQMAQKHVAEGYRWIVDLDLEKFFDRVNHDISVNCDGNIETIIGGSGNNSYIFEDTATFAGTIYAGIGGTNGLYFNEYTTALQIDLQAGTAVSATGDILIGHFNNISDITAGSGNDILLGSALTNRIDAGKGDDRVCGRSGDDYLITGEGDDFLEGGAGDDHPDGGAGTDTVSFASSTQGVEINLADAEGDDGFWTTDTFAGIENLQGSNYADTLDYSAADHGVSVDLTEGDGSF